MEVPGLKRVAIAILATGIGACATTPKPAPIGHIDHFVVGVPDRERAMIEFERQTGVKPVIGGTHPNGSTHNALISLGDHSYLELIATRPGAEPNEMTAVLAPLKQPTLVMFAVAVDDAQKASDLLRAAGYKPTAIRDGSRETPSGEVLRWRAFGLEDAIDGAPFFLEWAAGTPHPSTTSPTGCSLSNFWIESPNDAQLQKLLDTLGVTVDVHNAAQGELSLKLACPKAALTLSSGPELPASP